MPWAASGVSPIAAAGRTYEPSGTSRSGETAMRKITLMSLATLAGAGIGLLMFTEAGRGMVRRAGQGLRQLRDDVNEASAAAASKDLIETALDAPHPDTVMAAAMEEAVAQA